jgi:cbb3-type cytochrome c oxidase subunit III
MKNVRISAILAAAIGLGVLPGAHAGDRAAEIFNGFCNRCHGHEGQGIKGLEAPLIAGAPAWYVEAQLKKFREGARGTHPNDMPGMRMRPMANTLKESDVAGIAKYVANMPVQQPMHTLEGADPKKGETTFSSTCVGCHGADAKGNEQMGAPLLAGQDGWYLLTQLKNFKAGIRGGNPARDASGASMRAMVGTLDEATMKDIAAYLQSLPRK